MGNDGTTTESLGKSMKLSCALAWASHLQMGVAPAVYVSMLSDLRVRFVIHGRAEEPKKTHDDGEFLVGVMLIKHRKFTMALTNYEWVHPLFGRTSPQ